MTQAVPPVGPHAPARKSLPPSPPPGPSPAVAALLRVAATYPRAGLLLRAVEDGHPEEDLAHRAATLASLATEALAFLAGEARCGHLADSLWEQVSALEEAPVIRAPLLSPATDLADHRIECELEDRAFGWGKHGPGWHA